MNCFKRLSVTLSSRVDQMIGQIENHEAVVGRMIEDVGRAAAQAKVRLRRLYRDRQKLENEIAREQNALAMWHDRARASAESDREKALECMRRAKQCERTLAQYHPRLEEHIRIEKQLTDDVRAVEMRLGELQERRNVMRTRQSRAEAVDGLQDNVLAAAAVDDVFERWDTRITEVEMRTDCAIGTDGFEADFIAAEEQALLSAELDALIATEEA